MTFDLLQAIASALALFSAAGTAQSTGSSKSTSAASYSVSTKTTCSTQVWFGFIDVVRCSSTLITITPSIASTVAPTTANTAKLVTTTTVASTTSTTTSSTTTVPVTTPKSTTTTSITTPTTSAVSSSIASSSSTTKSSSSTVSSGSTSGASSVTGSSSSTTVSSSASGSVSGASTSSGSSSLSSSAMPSVASASTSPASSSLSSSSGSSISSLSTTTSSSSLSSLMSTTSSSTSESLTISSIASTTFASNLTTSSISSTVSSTSANATTTAAANSTNNFNYTCSGCAVDSTILVFARDSASASVATSGLNGYGIPFYVVLVPQAGVSLPALTKSNGDALYGGIIIASEVSYDYGASAGGFQSALTTAQWNQLYAYQTAYGVRMVLYEVYPGPNYGTTALGGCCGDGIEHYFYFTDTSAFTQAGLRTSASVTTEGLYHYPATITNTTTTKEIAQFAAGNGFGLSTAAVINNFSGRQQMVFFISFATDWSATSNLLQHAYITWMTRGLYAGYRRVNFNTQIDDMMLPTDIYYPAGYAYRTSPDDMTGIKNWIGTINKKMNLGSFFTLEIGYNGNGNILQSSLTNAGATACNPGAVDTGEHNDTALEFQKPLGTGSNAWPSTYTTYPFSVSCLNYDPLKVWYDTNKDTFMHISHTFSHYELNNSTYSDALKEIQWNQAWFQQAGFTAAKYFTNNGLIPPAITGLHNGDVLRAWTDAGLAHCVGDNTRPLLRNPTNPMYAAISNVQNNGFDGYMYIPRWATRIYYNCDTPICTVTEWINTSVGIPSNSTFDQLLATEKADTMRHLFGLYHDGYMFHQANLRNTGVNTITVNGVALQIGIMQAWVETQVQEFVRLVNWPMVSVTQGNLATLFANRAARDACNYKLTYQTSGSSITGVTVTANSNTCGTTIPVTIPGAVTSTQGFTTEQIGNDPMTIWVSLTGQPVSFTLSSPVSW